MGLLDLNDYYITMQKLTFSSLVTLFKPYKKRIFLTQLLAIIAVVLSLPIPLLFPMLIDEVLLHKPSWLTAFIDTLLHVDKAYSYIVVVFIATLLLRLLYFIFNALQIALFTTISKAIIFQVRKRLLEHLKGVSVAEYEALGGAGVSSKLVSDINTLDSFVTISIAKLFISALSLIGVAAILFWLNWKLALILLLLNPTVITISALLGRKIKELKRRENAKVENFQDALSETLDLFIQIRTFNQENRYITRMIDNAKAIEIASSQFGYKSEAATQFSALIFLAGFEFLRATAMIMVLYNEVSIGEMFAIMGYLWFMITPLQDIVGIVFSYANAKTAMQRLNAILELKQEPKYPHIHNPFATSTTNAISLKNITFSYGQKEVIHNVTLKIPKGKRVALLGSSGSGKSTLAHIILGLYATNSGEVYIDDIPVSEIGLDTLREHVALVLQNPRMFNDTLRQNISLGGDYSDETLYKALHVAQLGYLIEKLDKGLDTIIGKEGIRLSGGERQRLAIARMVVTNPNVIILDESTSALDVKTEALLFEALGEKLKNKTILIIAHRLSTINQADLIYVLKDGRIAEHGTPKDLINRGGLYASFVSEQ